MATAKDRRCRHCSSLIYRDSISGLCRPCFDKEVQASKPSTMVRTDRELERMRFEVQTIERKYAEARKQIRSLERSVQVIEDLRNSPVGTFDIAPREGSGQSEGTVFWVASDWHAEERVRPSEVSGLNEYNLDLAKARATRFFQGALRLTRLLQQDLPIKQAVMPLLGDFISNDIHEEVAEVAQLEPMHAITFARSLIVSGIEFILEHSELDLLIPCHSGNHARTTKTTRSATENGHSLEYLMYLHLADYFRNEPRIKFLIAEGYHSYLTVYGHTIRFHHGHNVKYQGGVGGIYIPVNKSIAQWNKARHADLDVFGHFHQALDGGNFICNGSLIGYNSYALSIKAGFELPKQQLFLIDKKRGRTCTWPILVEG